MLKFIIGRLRLNLTKGNCCCVSLQEMYSLHDVINEAEQTRVVLASRVTQQLHAKIILKIVKSTNMVTNGDFSQLRI